MKKNTIKLIVSIATLIISIVIGLYICGTGIKIYHSKLDGLNIKVPRYSLFIREFVTDNTNSLEFIMLGSEEHVQTELSKIYNQKHLGYTVVEWTYIDKGIYKIANLVYEK